MPYTLTNGASTKIVDSNIQKDELVRQGWTVADGSAEANLPFNQEDKVTNPTLGAFKGVGRAGEAPGTLAEACLKATEGTDQATYEFLIDTMRKGEGIVPAGSTEVNVVSALPGAAASGYVNKTYVLTARDTTYSKDPGVYYVEVGGTELNPTYTWAAVGE